MRKIELADLVKYNANNQGKSTPDCVKRALSLAFGMDYNDVSKELLEAAKQTFKYPRDGGWRYASVWSKVVEAHGGRQDGDDRRGAMQLGDFIDNELPHSGTFLVTTGKRPTSHSDHIVCIIDGKLYDSWDSRDQYVYKLYSFGDRLNVNRQSEIDIAAMSFNEVENLLDDFNYGDRIRDKASGMLGKKGYLDGVFQISAVSKSNYKVIIRCKVAFPPNQIQVKERIYKFTLDLVCSPFETRQSIKEKLDKVINVRLYDRMYAVLQNEAKDREKSELEYKIASQNNKIHKSRLYLDESEQRAFDSLPGWAQALATHFSVYAPNQYPDSYELYMIPLPDDPYRAQDDVVMVLAYNAKELKQKLEEYHDTYKITEDW